VTEKIKLRWFLIAGFLALMAIVIVVYRYTAVFTTNVMADREAWGQFGDYFGGVLNPLLSFAAFITLLITLRAQLVSEAKSEALVQGQVREQRMFQLLGMVSQSANNASYLTADQGVVVGHKAFHFVWHELRAKYSRGSPGIELSPMERYTRLETVYWVFRRTEWPAVSVFVESSFLLIEFIMRNTTISDGFVQFAMAALRVQVTEAERSLLWHVALFEPKYAYMLRILQAFDFVNSDPETGNDPLMFFAEELVQCAMVRANLRK
jgi:uncharacterized membrane protein